MTSLGVTEPADVPVVRARVLTSPTWLTATVAELEALCRFDRDGIAERAARAAEDARALGLTEVALRADLVGCDLLRRGGRLAEAGRIAQEVLRWATENRSGHLLARTSYVLSAVFQELGDLALALQHAIRAVDLLSEDAAAALRIDHLVRLADCLGLNGDEAAQQRYDEVLLLAEEAQDADRLLLILNNRAYCATLAGRHEEALLHIEELRARSVGYGVRLDVGRLDTVARVLMGLGRHEEAEAALLPGLAPEVLEASVDGDAGADFLLTLAEVRRQLGRVADAQRTLDECVVRCERHGLTAIRVRARREQAELHAVAGRFREAFEEHKRYTGALVELQSEQRDARARAMQAMYETTEARRQSRRYRELSLRDPLTGLYNRRYVDEHLPLLIAGGDDGPPGLAVALVDLDHFKRVNDTCSHGIGDAVLQAIAELLQDAVAAADHAGRSGSFAARLGGEEFLLVLTGDSPDATARSLDDLLRAVRGHPWEPLTGSVPVTVSIGWAGATPGSDDTPASLLGRADAHLYQAKHGGRDRVVGDLSR